MTEFMIFAKVSMATYYYHMFFRKWFCSIKITMTGGRKMRPEKISCQTTRSGSTKHKSTYLICKQHVASHEHFIKPTPYANQEDGKQNIYACRLS